MADYSNSDNDSVTSSHLSEDDGSVSGHESGHESGPERGPESGHESDQHGRGGMVACLPHDVRSQSR